MINDCVLSGKAFISIDDLDKNLVEAKGSVGEHLKFNVSICTGKDYKTDEYINQTLYLTTFRAHEIDKLFAFAEERQDDKTPMVEVCVICKYNPYLKEVTFKDYKNKKVTKPIVMSSFKLVEIQFLEKLESEKNDRKSRGGSGRSSSKSKGRKARDAEDYDEDDEDDDAEEEDVEETPRSKRTGKAQAPGKGKVNSSRRKKDIVEDDDDDDDLDLDLDDDTEESDDETAAASSKRGKSSSKKKIGRNSRTAHNDDDDVDYDDKDLGLDDLEGDDE